MRSLFLPAFAILAVSSAPAALINIAANGGASTASQSTTLNASFPATRAIDGVTTGVNPDITHTSASDPSPFWMVNLGVSIPVDSVAIWNRTDCCGGRLSDLKIELLDHNGAVVSTLASDFNDGNSLAAVPGDQHSSPGQTFTFEGNGAVARSLRISRNSSINSPGVLSLSEVQVFTDNVALDSVSFGGSVSHIGGTNGAGPVLNAIDGNLGNFSHTANSNGNASPDALILDLGRVQNIDSLILHNRDSCCGGRLRDLTVDLLAADSSTVLYTSGLLNPDNILGGGLGNFGSGPATLNLDLHQLTGGSINGAQFVRVSRTASSVGSGDDQNILSLGELQVFGVPEPSRALLLAFGAVALAARRCR